MPVTIRTTFETITPESAELGDAAARGWIDEDGTEFDFRELVELLRHCAPSCYPVQSDPAGVWFTDYEYSTDYATGATESRSYHPADDRAARWMVRAWKWAQH